MSSFQLMPEGTVLGGDFEIVRLLRHGGMGSVYEAVQRTTGASRAIKVMRGALATDARFRSRFEQEARVSSRIKSDHVVQVVSAGVDDANHMPWIAMELLDGQDLGEWLERHRRMPWADASGALGQLCHALGAAHAVGVVHRDLKPENIFLSRSRIVGVPFMVKVLDFGVAKVVSEARMATVAVGTPFYMAPEQTHPSAEVSPATDVWALGLLAYRMLAGMPFWRAAQAENDGLARLWREVLIDPIPNAFERARETGVDPLLPPGFDEWFARCVAREPSDRYENANAACAALLPMLDEAAGIASSTLVAAGRTDGSGFSESAPTMSISSVGRESLPVTPRLSGISLTPRDRKRSKVTFREAGERVIFEAETGSTLLACSLAANVPHYHACGGRGRCTTCRVVVLDGLASAGPRTPLEAKVATARRWPDTIRLACQMTVNGDLTARRLVVDQGDVSLVNALQETQEPTSEIAAVAHISLTDFEVFSREQFPHDVVHVLNRYLRNLVEPVVANGGSVLHYTPSGVTVCFSGPGREATTLALDAVRAALRIIARVRQLNPYTLKHFGREFGIAIGIDIGQLLRAQVGHASKVEQLAFGQAVAGSASASRYAEASGISIAAGRAVIDALGEKIAVGRRSGQTGEGDFVEVIDFATPDVVYLVQSTFERVLPRADEFASGFYERVFEMHPQAAELFEHTDMTQQRKMLMDVLATAIRGLERIQEMVPSLEAMGRRHVEYGVRPIHYKYVGRALLETLEDFLGGDFTPEVHVAWMEIYQTLARTMIDAGETMELAASAS